MSPDAMQRRCGALALCGCLALHGWPGLPQQGAATPRAAHEAASASAAKYRVAGWIVSERDGRPLQGALVRLLDGKQQPVASVVADAEGRFAFENVAAGKYPLEGRMLGYTASRYEQHGEFSTAIVTGAGVDTESLVLKLTPEAMLSGRVTDDQGEPVRARMVLYRESGDTGDLRIMQVRNAQANDLGEYEMDRLQPGRYYLAAIATPWYAVHPQPPPPTPEEMAALINQQTGNRQMGSRAGSPTAGSARAVRQTPPGVVDGIDASLDVAYATTFYPGVTDSTGAEAIVVKGGEQIAVDLKLSAVPAVTLTIPRDPGDKNQAFPMLQRTVFDSLEQGLGVGMSNSATEYRIAGVAPGTYVLKQMGNPQGGVAKTGTVDLTGRSIALDPGWGQESGSVKLTVQGVDGAKLPRPIQVALVRKGSRALTNAAINQKGEAEMRGLEPGEYHFSLGTGQRQYFVAQVLSDGHPLAGGEVRVTAGAALPVTVVVVAGNGSVAGTAKKDGRPAAGAMVALVPVDDDYRSQHVWRQQSNLDGSFEIDGLPAGRYIGVAIDGLGDSDGWDLEWQRQEVQLRYLPLGVAVAVPEGGKVNLADAVAVQAR